MSSRRAASLLGLFIATVSWGASFFLIKAAVVQVGVWPYLSYRLVGATVLIILVFPSKFFRPTRGLVLRGSILGFLLFLAIWTQTTGLEQTTASRSGFLTALYVPFTPLVGWLFFRQQIFFKQILAALVALTGLYILTNPGNLTTGLITWWTAMNPGDIWTIGTALVAAVHITLTEKFTRQEADSIALGIWQFVWCAVWVILTVAVKSERGLVEAPLSWNIIRWPTIALVSVAFNAVLATCFSFIVQIVAQKTIGAMKTALIFAMEAPFASCFAYGFLGEVMAPRELMGAAMVFLTGIIPEAWLKSPLTVGERDGSL